MVLCRVGEKVVALNQQGEALLVLLGVWWLLVVLCSERWAIECAVLIWVNLELVEDLVDTGALKSLREYAERCMLHYELRSCAD